MKIDKIIAGTLAIGAILAVRAAMRSARFAPVHQRVVLITGGSRGLGLVMARQLIKEGAKVVICARDEQELARASESIGSSDLLTVACDITDKAQVSTMIETIRREMGEVEMLINNAGTIQVGPMETMTEEDYKKAIDIHFWGPYNVINAVLPTMRKNKTGRIANIISINGKVSFPHLLPYTVSKYAMSGYSEGLTAELAKDNIYITSVYPGLMRTGSPIHVEVKGQFQKEFAWFKIFDSLPLLSMNAERAARKIIRSIKAGDKILLLGFPTKLAVAIHGLFPNINLTFFGISNSLLPEPNGSGTKSKSGYESRSWLSSNFLTRWTDAAAFKNNERLN